MPRRNFLVIMAVAIVSFACHQVADRNPYGRYFADIVSKVDRLYVAPVNDDQLFNSAIAGMLKDLDKYSVFLPPPEASRLMAMIDQHFDGIGVMLDYDAKLNKLTVMETLADSPAAQADIQAGDQILKVNGVAIEKSDTEGVIEQAGQLIRGPRGTKVVLTLSRASVKNPFERELVRAEIKTDSVVGERRQPDRAWDYWLPGHPRIAYLRLNVFGERTGQEVTDVLAKLKPQGIQGLIIDLRSNGGGALEAAVKVCSLFIPEGETIVTTRGRDKQIVKEELAEGPGTYTDFPIAVLINGDTASASEIVAACLQDQHRAVIVGERSFGKGTVQQVFKIGDAGSRLKLTTSTYWRPSNKNIHRMTGMKDSDEWGVVPDEGFAVKVDDKELTKMHEDRKQRELPRRAVAGAGNIAADTPAEVYIDPQLRRAIEAVESRK